MINNADFHLLKTNYTRQFTCINIWYFNYYYILKIKKNGYITEWLSDLHKVTWSGSDKARFYAHVYGPRTLWFCFFTTQIYWYSQTIHWILIAFSVWTVHLDLNLVKYPAFLISKVLFVPVLYSQKESKLGYLPIFSPMKGWYFTYWWHSTYQ